jgi:CRP-like cAMP-binding protein
MERWPLLALNMAKYLQEQRSAAMSTIEDVAYLPVPQRILNLLERLANEDGVVEDDGTRIDLHLTHADIAAMIGSTRETVSTELARLVKSRRVLVRDRSYVWPRCTQPPIRLEPLDIADLRVAPIVIRLASTSVV